MGKQTFGRKRGMKRRLEQNLSRNKQNLKKNRRLSRQEKLNRTPSPDDSAEENLEIALEEEMEEQKNEEEEIMDYKEPTIYDSLLESLRTKQEEYNTDSEKSGDDVEQAHGASDDDNEGSDSENSSLSESGASLHGGVLGNPVERIGGTETDDDDSEASGSDGEQGLGVNGQPTRGACASTSSFHSHLDHKLSKEEIDKLEKKKWTYKWVVAMSNYKWRGTGECFLKEQDSFLFHGLKPTLHKHWLGIYEKSGGADFDSSKQILFFSICNSYRDILHHNKKPFYLKGLEEDSSTMDAYVMHSLNHIFRTRDLVKKNEAKLAKLQENVKADILSNEAFLDRGFTRPKVLILLPLASVAFRVVKRLIDLTPPKYKSSVEEHERFYREFGTGVSEDKEDEDAAEISESKRSSKPSDFETLFGGNNNDHFMIGIKFTRRSIRLYSDFYSSDMIVASPLGLITKIGEAELYKDKNVDYLSSIEVKLASEYKGVLPKVVLQIRQIYERFDAKTAEDADDARFAYFTKKGGIMLFISSYFEFIRIRNFLKSQEASFCLLGEYTEQSDISCARVWFFDGKKKIMLYTERAHFYHRYKIRGIQNLIIYSLPERKEFYPEVVNMLQGSACTVLFSRLDQLRLERIVGTAAAKRMVTSDKGVFVFC